jgi:phosphoglycolate phosphatase-like HAD superfamily hydrolase
MRLHLPRRKIVIFDIDGTLLELLQDEVNAYLKAFDVSYGITGLSDDWDSYQYRNDVAIAREIISKHFARPCTTEELSELLNTYAFLLQREVYGQGIMPKLISGVTGVINALEKNGNIGLALATANPEQISKLRLETAGIWKYFGCGAFAEDGNDKTLILSKALNRCREKWYEHINIEDVIFIGDHNSDVVAAQILGVHFIRITEQPKQLSKSIIYKIYPDYGDLNSFLSHMEFLWNNPLKM